MRFAVATKHPHKLIVCVSRSYSETSVIKEPRVQYTPLAYLVKRMHTSILTSKISFQKDRSETAEFLATFAYRQEAILHEKIQNHRDVAISGAFLPQERCRLSFVSTGVFASS